MLVSRESAEDAIVVANLVVLATARIIAADAVTDGCVPDVLSTCVGCRLAGAFAILDEHIRKSREVTPWSDT